MKVLIDTNVVLDLLLDRQPFSEAAAQLFSKIEDGSLTGFMGATTVTTIHYIATKSIGNEKALQEINKLFSMFEIAPVDRVVLEKALKTILPDFEDAVLYEAGKRVGVEAIVTRDSEGFDRSTCPVYSPDDFLKAYVFIQKKWIMTLCMISLVFGAMTSSTVNNIISYRRNLIYARSGEKWRF